MPTVRRLRNTPALLAGALLALLTAGCSGSPAVPASPAGTLAPGTGTANGAPTPTTGTGAPSGGRTSGAPTTAGTTAPPTTTTPTTVAPVAGCPQHPSTFTAAPGTGRTVALTFDDGASTFSLQIARVLRSRGVTATFFDVGRDDQAQADIVRQVAALGFPVEDHSWDHQYPAAVHGGWTVAYVRDQIARTATLQEQLTGHRPCYFRPPGGFMTDVRQAAYGLGTSVVLWSVDTLDWRQPGVTTAAATSAIVARATAIGGQLHPVVLMHSGKASSEPDSVVSPYRGNTVAALPAIVDWYAAHGYRFVAF